MPLSASEARTVKSTVFTLSGANVFNSTDVVELVNSVIVGAVLAYLFTLTSTVSLTAGLFAASLTLRVKLSSVAPKLKLSKLYAFVNVYSFPFLL